MWSYWSAQRGLLSWPARVYFDMAAMLQVQEALLYVHWEPEVLLLQHCSPVFCPVPNQPDCLMYAGPRVRMGIYEGVPLRIQPHTATGRADYFGKLVNR